MQRAASAVLLSLAFTLHAQSGSCPQEKPHQAMVMTFADCTVYTVCGHGVQHQLDLQSWSAGGAYVLQACDEVTWDFGDGTPPQKSPLGTANITHTWTSPGNYEIRATIRNALGEATVWREWVINRDVVILGWPWLPDVSETAGSVSIPVRRSGSSAGRVAATLRVRPEASRPTPAIADSSIRVVFEPGQIERVITLPVRDNDAYDGTRWAMISLEEPEGGVFFNYGPMRITDDEPQPTLTCHDASVREGDSGPTIAAIPCTLSAPLGYHLDLYGILHPLTTTRDEFFWDAGRPRLVAGRTDVTIEVIVHGDTEVESSEQLSFTLGTFFVESPPIKGPPVTLTILNDDAALRGSLRRAGVGEPVTFTLHPGVQYEEPTEIPLRSTDPSVLRVPATVLVPPSADQVTFVAETLAEGVAVVEADLGTQVLTDDLFVHELRTIVPSASALALPPGGATTLTLSLTPASSGPVTVQLTADSQIVDVPAAVTIPAGGEVRVDVRGLALGNTTISLTSGADGVTGTMVQVDVTQGRKRRSAR